MLGNILGGIGSAAGGAAGGLGSFLFGSPGSASFGQYSQNFASKATSGLGLPEILMGSGVGLSMASAFGKSGAGTSMLQRIPLSKGGRKLQTSLYEQTKKQISGRNLAEADVKAYMSVQKGRLKRQGQQQERALQSATSSLAARDLKTGEGLKGALVGMGGLVEGRAAPELWEADFKGQEFMKGLMGASNIRNLELQSAQLSSMGAMSGGLIGAQRKAAMGASLGGMAEFLAKLAYPPYKG